MSVDSRLVFLAGRRAELERELERVQAEREAIVQEVVSRLAGQSSRVREGHHACPDPDFERQLLVRRNNWPVEPAARAIFEQLEQEARAGHVAQVPSPTGRCCYLEDSEECLFCGDPEDRQ